MGRCARGELMIHGLKLSGAVLYVQGVSDLLFLDHCYYQIISQFKNNCYYFEISIHNSFNIKIYYMYMSVM